MWEEPYKQRLGDLARPLDPADHRQFPGGQDYLAAKGIAREKIGVIENGVDTSRFDGPVTPHATREELGIPQHHAVVGHLARLEPQKDPRTFLAAAAIIAQTMPDCLLSRRRRRQPSAGPSSERRKALGLGERMVFTGPRRDVPRLLAACDVSVLSSVKEGMSNTIMESMAAGKPMVATRVGGNAELIEDGETGFLVPPRDPVALADAMQRMLGDEAMAKAMGLRARARIAERFSVDAMVAATQRLYDALVSAAAPRRRDRPARAEQRRR